MIRRFKESDAAEVAELIRKTMRISNSRDYPHEWIENCAALFTPEYVKQRAGWTHFYVVCENNMLIGCGAIGPYWDSMDESCLFTIFVLPEYQGKGYGRKIIEVLEQDEFFLRARRIEIPASITACEFYRSFGYDFKDSIEETDDEGHYRLEKFRTLPT